MASLFNSDYIFPPELCEILPSFPIIQDENQMLNEETPFLWNQQETFSSYDDDHQNGYYPSNTFIPSSNLVDDNTTLSSLFFDVSSSFQEVSQHHHEQQEEQVGMGMMGYQPINEFMGQSSSLLDYFDIDIFNNGVTTTTTTTTNDDILNSGVYDNVKSHMSMEMSSSSSISSTNTYFHEGAAACSRNELKNHKKSDELIGLGQNNQAVYYGLDHHQLASNVWEIQPNYKVNSTQIKSIDQEETMSIGASKVRRYSEQERKDRILKYLKKRNQRNFNKTIKYACRKTLADRRIRIRGRFARNNERNDESITTPKKTHNHQEEYEYYSDGYQMKNNEDWLQEAVSNLMYLPVFAE